MVALSQNERIGGYNVLGVLGYGANSTIYAVQEPKSGQLYAMKHVAVESPTDHRFVDQTVNEYGVAAKIKHPVIRECLALKRRRQLFKTKEIMLVMELVDGKNLVRHRPPTLRELIQVFVSTADALTAMHRAGYVHADMKPNNILLTEKGAVKLIDFGQSCPIGTVKERIQGTPDYIAPEQVKRKSLTAETDIFNLGASIYWCVTDRHVPTLIPKGENKIRLKKDMQPAEELIEPKELNPGLPPLLNKLLLDCLKQRPEDRPESMTEVREKLKAVAAQVPPDRPCNAGQTADERSGEPGEGPPRPGTNRSRRDVVGVSAQA